MPEIRKPQKQPNDKPVVFIIDDDPSMRESLADLFLSMQFDAEAFETAAAFMAKFPNQSRMERPGCILLDVRLPGISGLDFQSQLEKSGIRLPVVFMTGFGDIPMTVRAMKAGAVDFLTKPFKEQDVLDAVSSAVQRDSVRRQEAAQNQAVVELVQTLTPREREVMDAVVTGKMNKQIAFDLGISEVTVKLHRGNVMRKMDVRSLADLVRKAEFLSETTK
ncbi:response regulator transcription factor [Brucella pseudogrignonensis]|jgi:FixJ family two-component response regulator|uniref:response regulator transcription factor n=1 Tax=Brucella TaxID=234 RepID=UPI0007DA81BC|nr:response regulator transcription factor [Brucella pseudogrignonensis]ANG96930.1 DNA-binding response regulator [Brucella pseudogrignonensis]MBO1027579.1 response regulator transcription factor [Ochrobactrum sp. SD129]MCD4509933.1 response regulator transcription factor [Brucella pseudogrignonensis]